jgi:A/G-specific adenine glycosylase
VARFPTVEALANAPLEKVLKTWEGVGYYARAHNLHRAAVIIAEREGGRLPETEQELVQLPGIGRYTAAALLAIVFHQDTLALEGNLRRVLTRLFDVHLDPRERKGERELQRRGLSVLPSGRASEFNQALMDLGALICTPRSPACGDCPLSNHCLALRNGTQELLPIRAPKGPLPLRRAVAAVVLDNDSVLIVRHPEGGLLGGLWGLPGGFIEDGEENHQALTRVIREELGLEVEIDGPMMPLTHTYTHFQTTLQPFACRVRSSSHQLKERGDIRWVGAEDLDELPMGKIDRMLARELGKSLNI